MSNPWTWRYLYRLVNERFYTEFEKSSSYFRSRRTLRYEKLLPLNQFNALYMEDHEDHVQLYLPNESDKIRVVVDVASNDGDGYYICNVEILFDHNYNVGPGWQDSGNNVLGHEAVVAELLANCTVDDTDQELNRIIVRFNKYFGGNRFVLTMDRGKCELHIKNKKKSDPNDRLQSRFNEMCIINKGLLIQRMELSHVFLEVLWDINYLMPCGLEWQEAVAIQLILSFSDVNEYIGIQKVKKETIQRLISQLHGGHSVWKLLNCEKEHIEKTITEKIENLHLNIHYIEWARMIEDPEYSISRVPF